MDLRAIVTMCVFILLAWSEGERGKSALAYRFLLSHFVFALLQRCRQNLAREVFGLLVALG